MPAGIVVEGERIVEVRKGGRAEMEGLELEDVGDRVISPGIIDGNVQENGAWDGLSSISKSAVAGGVTFLAVEPSIYNQNCSISDSLYCDIGKIALIGLLSQDEVTAELSQGAFALKAYLFPPSAYVTGIALQLKAVFAVAAQHQVPLIIDVAYPSARMLYMASPCRLVTLEERAKLERFSEDKFFAGAFPEEIDPYSASIHSDSDSVSGSDDEDEDEVGESLQGFEVKATTSGLTSPNVKFDHTDFPRTSTSIGPDPPKLRQVRSFQVKTQRPIQPQLFRAPTVFSIAETRRSSFQCHTIYEDLKKRIDANRGNIENISRVELMAYNQAGATEFLSMSSSRKRSNSIIDKSPKLEVLQEPLFTHSPQVSEFSLPDNGKSAHKERFQRPTGLQIVKEEEHKDTSNHDRHYIYHIANHPDHWETNGLELVRAQLPVPSTFHLHLCNLSSAASFSRLNRGKELRISTETCPHYLCYSMENVGEGDTRMKVLPPIRNKANCNLLWDLLKMGQIDMIQSHHSFIPSSYKFLSSGSFKKALNGIPGLGFSLQSVWTHLRRPNPYSQSLPHYLVRMSKWLSTAPAKMLGVEQDRGTLEVGKLADLIVWSPEEETVGQAVCPEPEMCPYSGERLFGRVEKVYVRGQVAYGEGEWRAVGQTRRR